jgi:hypothetical protein
MMKINFSLRYRKQEEIVTREIAGETLLVPIRSKLADMQRIFGLNAVGEYIWQQLDGRRSLTEIHNEIVDDFDVTGEQAKIDIQEFIGQLLEADIITEAAGNDTEEE